MFSVFFATSDESLPHVTTQRSFSILKRQSKISAQWIGKFFYLHFWHVIFKGNVKHQIWMFPDTVLKKNVMYNRCVL